RWLGMRDNLPGLGWGDVHLAPKKSLVATACVVEVAVVDNQLLCRFVVVGTGNPRSWYRVSG
ncbi:hypothetical protein, partial [Corynebacterium striatum]